jgi:4-hydroxy 2-oxovalerate aldolase
MFLFSDILSNIDRKNSKFVAMIDFGRFDIHRVVPSSKSKIDGIRLIFKKKDRIEALDYARKLIQLGYEIFINPVSITTYTTDEIRSLLININNIVPTGVSIVDTYGLMYDDDLEHYFQIFDEIIPENISIGYHSHNNLQLAYSNSIHLMKISGNRPIIIDSSLYGMGKGAGNGNTELLALYLNRKYSADYDIEHLLETIDTDILKEFERNKWGYTLSGYIAASSKCHPEYVKKLLAARTLSISQVKEIIDNIPPSSRLSYDDHSLNKSISDHASKVIEDSASNDRLTNELKDREILLLGPGASLLKERETILNYIDTAKPLVFCVNFTIEGYPTDYVFMSNSKRFSQFFDLLIGNDLKVKIICTSNVHDFDGKATYVFDFESVKYGDSSISSNPLILLIRILEKCGISSITLAGFDGYDSPQVAKNYYHEYHHLLYDITDVEKRNCLIRTFIASSERSACIHSITPTKYLN